MSSADVTIRIVRAPNRSRSVEDEARRALIRAIVATLVTE
jgi:plasmid stability protein